LRHELRKQEDKNFSLEQWKANILAKAHAEQNAFLITQKARLASNHAEVHSN